MVLTVMVKRKCENNMYEEFTGLAETRLAQNTSNYIKVIYTTLKLLTFDIFYVKLRSFHIFKYDLTILSQPSLSQPSNLLI